MKGPETSLASGKTMNCRTLREDKLRSAALAIGAITVVSGASQAVAPRLVLRLVGADRSAASAQLFATVGAFMVVVGGALTHATLRDPAPQVVLLWSTLQKVSAVAAVGLGVRSGIFKPRALAVAAFDLASASALAVFTARSFAGRAVTGGSANGRAGNCTPGAWVQGSARQP